jgi:hypothetical protein
MDKYLRSIVIVLLSLSVICCSISCSHALVSNSYEKNVTPKSNIEIKKPARTVYFKVTGSPVVKKGTNDTEDATVDDEIIEVPRKKVRVKRLDDGRIVIQVIVEKEEN